MQDLSKIDFSKCKLPEWGGHTFAYLEPTGVTVAWSPHSSQQHGARHDLMTRGHGKPWKIITSSLTREETDLLWSMTDTVDAFIGSELAKQTEPKWRTCLKEFAMANPEVSQARVYPFDDYGHDWFSLDTFAFNSPPYLYEFRTKAPLPQQPDPLDARNPGRTYSAKAPETGPKIADLAAQVNRLRRQIRRLEKMGEKAK